MRRLGAAGRSQALQGAGSGDMADRRSSVNTYLLLAIVLLAAHSIFVSLSSSPKAVPSGQPSGDAGTHAWWQGMLEGHAVHRHPSYIIHQVNVSGAMAIAQQALLKHEPGQIPKLIHQVYGLYSHGPPPRWAQRSIHSYKQANPGHTHILWSAHDLEVFVDTHFPSLSITFRALKLPILRADLARYLLVYTYGGVYADLDTRALRPVDAWTDGRDNVSMVVGVEADAKDIPNWQRSYGRQLQMVQWAFVAEPGHPVLALTVYSITRALLAVEPSAVTQDMVTAITGPSVFTDAVYAYIAIKGHRWQEYLGMRSAQLIGDLYLLTITGFSPGVGHMGAGDVSHPAACVQHLFKGSWTDQGLAPGQRDPLADKKAREAAAGLHDRH